MPSIVGVIPARYASKRFPGKPLALLKGKSIIWWVFNQAKKALDNVLIATDDERIKKEAENFGANVIMTSPEHPSGTDRIGEVVKTLDVSLVINIQGDQPLIPPEMIQGVIKELQNPSILMATLKKEIDKNLADNPNIVKVVVDKDDFALYFSRGKIPYSGRYYKHIGIYGYKKDFLLTFINLPKGKLEIEEDLEQLRALENGYKIKVATTEYDSPSIDTKEDLKEIQKYYNFILKPV
ncbi:MAG: 3-deoxy-manno-octulosonate cytidylyltransferase [bacterium]